MKNKKTIKSDIAVAPVETRLSENRLMVKYVYVYVEGFNAARVKKELDRERRKDWKQYDSDSVVHWGDKSHLWVYTSFWKAKKPTKRIKRS